MLLPKVYLKSAVIVLLLCLVSCASKQQVTVKEPEVVTPPKIIFINYLLAKNAQDEKSITLINQITAEGKLKGKPEKVENTSFGDLEYIFLDKDFKEIEKHALKNPLKKTVEYINDFGKFEKRVLDLDSVQFSIRMQLLPKAKYIVITELTTTKQKKHITTKID